MRAMLAALFAQGIVSEAGRMLAMKIFLRAMLILLVPVLAMLAFNAVLGTVVNYVISEVNAVNPDGTTPVNFSGMFLYLYAALGVDVFVSACVGALSTKMLLRSIPFVHL